MAALSQTEIDELTQTLRAARGERAAVDPPARQDSPRVPADSVVIDRQFAQTCAASLSVLPWTWFRDRLRNSGGWLLSAAMHAAVLVMLGSFLLPDRPASRVTQLETVLADPDVVPDVAELAIIAPPESQPGPAFGGAQRLADGMAALESSAVPHDAASRGAIPSHLPIAAPAAHGDETGAGQTSASSGFPTRLDQLGPVGPAAKFFGSVAYGDRFVFVLDCSGSMGDGARFPRAVQELLRTLDGMDEQQFFQVVLFDSGAHPLVNETGSAADLLPATAENKQRLAVWLAAVQPRGWSDPRLALNLAISLRPSAIFLLSDGEFKIGPVEKMIGHDTLQGVRKQNRARAPIHTLAFEDPANRGVLRAMAKGSGGTYRYVPPLDRNAHRQDNAASTVSSVIGALQ